MLYNLGVATIYVTGCFGLIYLIFTDFLNYTEDEEE